MKRKILIFLFILVILTSNSFGTIRISLTDKENEIRFTWNTHNISTTPFLLISKNNLNLKDQSNSDSIVDQINCSTESLYDHKEWLGYIHSGIAKLESFTTYYYVVGDKNQKIYSQQFNFTTNNISFKSANVQPHSVVCYGDMGEAGESENTIKSIMKNIDRYSMAIHLGDIAYADHIPHGHQETWNIFLNQILPISTKIPYMVCPGNHDTFERGEIYRKTFQMPGKHNYTYILNGIQYLSFSTEHDYSQDSKQYKWIENELKRIRSENPDGWLVVWAHRPLYCSSSKDWCSGKSKDRVNYAKTFEELFRKYNIDLFIAAHAHSYERTLPVYKNKVYGGYKDPKATVHIVVGTAGNRNGNTKGWQDHRPVWSDGARLLSNGFGVINFANKTHLQWQFIQNSDNQVKDQFWLTKGFFS